MRETKMLEYGLTQMNETIKEGMKQGAFQLQHLERVSKNMIAAQQS